MPRQPLAPAAAASAVADQPGTPSAGRGNPDQRGGQAEDLGDHEHRQDVHPPRRQAAEEVAEPPREARAEGQRDRAALVGRLVGSPRRRRAGSRGRERPPPRCARRCDRGARRPRAGARQAHPGRARPHAPRSAAARGGRGRAGAPPRSRGKRGPGSARAPCRRRAGARPRAGGRHAAVDGAGRSRVPSVATPTVCSSRPPA